MRRAALVLAAFGAAACGSHVVHEDDLFTTTNPTDAPIRFDGPPPVRVLLTAPTKAGKGRIRIRGGYIVRSLDGRKLSTSSMLDAPLKAGRGPLSLGDLALPWKGAQLMPASDGDLRVDDRRYPGILRVSRSMDGRYRIYVDTDMERYLPGVVSGEIPAKFPKESQRVQAIVARTYAISRFPHAFRGDPILLSDSGLDDQEFRGIPKVSAHARIAREAVRSTRGLVAFDGERPLRAWYHSTCGGHTAPAGPVFGVKHGRSLGGVPCDTCTESKYYRWTARIDGAAVVKAAKMTGEFESFRVAELMTGDRAESFEVRAGGKTKRVPAVDFRLAVGPSLMRSAWITSVRIDGPELVLVGSGWGHGVGLCQMGAKGLADQGVKAERIVRLYYPGVRVHRAW